MSRVVRWKAGATCAAALALSVAAGAATPAWAQGGRGAGPLDPGMALRADIKVSTRHVTADGTAGRTQGPATAMQFERRLVEGRWRNVVTYRDIDRPKVQTGGTEVELSNPFRISRVEIDEASGKATAFDRRGRPVALPSEDDARRLGERGSDARAAALAKQLPLRAVALPDSAGAQRLWRGAAPGDIVARAHDAGERRRTLAARLGQPTGKVRGLDRYVAVDAGTVTEVLVEPTAALPVEINVAKGGRLEQRIGVRYRPFADGHIREHVTVERAVGEDLTERLITEIELANVVVPAGGRP